MRWILCGKNDAAVDALLFLLERGDDVWAVGVRGDEGRDGWQRSLAKAARAAGTRFTQPRRINAPETAAELAGFGADALISIQYDQILKDPLFERLGHPCLNLHFALLPRHRGVAPIAWALLSGDREAGVTLHHMVEDIDAGDVVAQKAVPIAPDGTARELYDDLTAAAVELFRECYPFGPELLARRLPQDARAASYHRNGDFDFSDKRTDWSQPAADLQRWMRAMIFPPMQHPETRHGGRALAIARVGGELAGGSDAPPGTVIAASRRELVVAAADAALRIRALEADGEDALATIAVGDRFE
jgi:methionyl-tRNA formyltransferase